LAAEVTKKTSEAHMLGEAFQGAHTCMYMCRPWGSSHRKIRVCKIIFC
jgi:hypothetical protein